MKAGGEYMKNETNRKTTLFSERLHEALRDNDMSPIELSKRASIPKSMVSYYLSGKTQPKADRLYTIAQLLGVSEAWLMGYDVAKTRTEAQKKNDQVVKLVAQLRENVGFYELVCDVAELPAEQYASIKHLVSALRNK
jgi:transcriptional regulator with XRE-family HTH domain